MTINNTETASLHSAFLNNDIKKIEELIKSGADLKSPNDKGQKPLHVALMRNNKKVVKLLLNSDQEIEVDMTAWIYAIVLDNKKITSLLASKSFDFSKATNSQGETLIHYCVKHRSLNMLNHVGINNENINQADVNGYSPLHLAIINNDIPMVKRLLELGANVYAKTMDGRSSIHFAVKHQCIETLLLLIEANVDVNDPVTSTGSRPLHIAVENNDMSTVNLLIRSGADLHCVDDKGKNLLHVAVENVLEDMLKFLLKKKIDVNARFGKKQKSVLDLALCTKNTQIITTVLNHNPDLNSKNRDGLSAIFIALQSACLQGANEIFLLKPDFDIVTNDGVSLLHYAFEYKHEGIINYLLENNINIDKIDNRGQNSLHYAAHFGNAKVVSLLIDKNLDINAKTKEGNTPLHYAVLNFSNENFDTVKILLNSGANINAENNAKQTPLFLIKYNDKINMLNKKEMFKLLLDKGADVNRFDDIGHGLCYYYAQELSSLMYQDDIFSSLIEHNFNFNKINSDNDNIFHFMAERNLFCVNTFEQCIKNLNGININAVNNNNETPLNLCLKNGAPPKLVTYLVKDRGAVANLNKEGENPLHLSIKAQQYETTKFFMKNNEALIHEFTANGSTALHYAVKYCKQNEKYDESKDILKLLLEYVIKDIIDAKDNDGKTALHLAVFNNSLEMVKALLEVGDIDINAKDKEDNSPLCYAISNKNLSMVKLLLKNGVCIDDKHRELSIYDLAKESGDTHIYNTILLFEIHQ